MDDDWVQALVCDSTGRLYAGGAFDQAGGVDVSAVAQWTGAAWGPVGTGMNNFVNALARDAGGNIYAGGFFTVAGGVIVNRVARWSGGAWVPLGPAPAPVIVSISASGAADMTVEWSATNGVWYALQWATAPGSSTWNDILPTNRVGPASPPWVLRGTNTDARLSVARFYRVRAARVP
jgi:hypothetical protein